MLAAGGHRGGRSCGNGSWGPGSRALSSRGRSPAFPLYWPSSRVCPLLALDEALVPGTPRGPSFLQHLRAAPAAGRGAEEGVVWLPSVRPASLWKMMLNIDGKQSPGPRVGLRRRARGQLRMPARERAAKGWGSRPSGPLWGPLPSRWLRVLRGSSQRCPCVG